MKRAELLPTEQRGCSASQRRNQRRLLLPPEARGMQQSVLVHLLPRFTKDTSAKSQELTQIERDVLTWLAHGKRPLDIAEIMCMRANNTHQILHRIKDKLGCNTNAGAVARALRTGLIK